MTTTDRRGEVYDLGYQRYEGGREGAGRARWAIARDGMRGALGLGRSASAKILPLGIIVVTLFPAVIVMVVAGFIASFGGDIQRFADNISGLSNREYYSFAFVGVMLFAATIGPEMLCPDRRSGVLVLYLVRPITSLDYVGARATGFFAVMTGILWLPQLLVFSTLALVASSPFGYIRDHLDVLPRAALSGLVIAAFFTALAFAVSALTDRRAYAAAGILGVLLISSAVSGIASELVGGHTGDLIMLLDVGNGLLRVNDAIFGALDAPLPAAAYVAAEAAAAAAMVAIVWWRYRRPAL
jgi:ABC-2 type transport system permease protein